MLCDAATCEQQLRESFGNAKRTLRLGLLASFLDDLVAPVVRELKKKHRGIAVSLFDLPPRAQLERLAAHELHAALLANLEPAHREQFVVKPLSRHRFAAVLAEGHPHAGANSLPLAALREEDWVSLSDHAFPGRREFLRAACAAAGFEPRIVAEADTLTAMLGAVATGDGVAIAPRHSEKLPHAGCVFIALRSPAPTVELMLVSPRGVDVPELRTLKQLLMTRARELSDG